MLYYSNGGPGPASRLLRVDAPEGADIVAWRRAPAWSWQPKTGWRPDIHAQLDILGTGDLFMVDESQVSRIQGDMQAQYDRLKYPAPQAN